MIPLTLGAAIAIILSLAFAALHKILRRGAGKDSWCD